MISETELVITKPLPVHVLQFVFCSSECAPNSSKAIRESSSLSCCNQVQNFIPSRLGNFNGERKAEFGFMYTFIGVCALKVDHGAKSPEDTPFIERF